MLKFLKNYLKYLMNIYKSKKRQKRKLYNYIDLDVIENKFPKKVNRIIFIIPSMAKFSGGHTSILRLGTELSKKYEVFYASYIEDNIDKMKNAAFINLKNYKGKIINLSEIETNEEDILIATLWESVYFSKKLKGYKMYFIQDYEPYFYSYGEDYILAKETYNFGYHIVSLGKWNLKKIKEENSGKNSILNFIEFPYEKKEYPNIGRDYSLYKEKKEIKLCVYVKNESKRIPYIIENILKKLKFELKEKKNIDLLITYFGNENYLNLSEGKSLGKITKEQLLKLYQESDFGMCASLTNISLVPYEMMATGLPVIEFIEGSFTSFFSEECGILTDFNYKTLLEKMIYYLENPNLIEKCCQSAKEELKNLSWQKSGQQFINIIENLNKIGDNFND